LAATSYQRVAILMDNKHMCIYAYIYPREEEIKSIIVISALLHKQNPGLKN
jgi:hypothetical protein